MDSPQFNVVVDGAVLDGFSADTVAIQLQQQLKLPAARAQALIAGKRVTVKRAVDASTADVYCQRLRNIGLSARVEPSATNAAAPVQTVAAPPDRRPERNFFADTALPSTSTRTSVAFTRAVMRAGFELSATILGYAIATLYSIALLLFYLVDYASFLKVPPFIFSATVYFSVSLLLTAVAVLLLRPWLPCSRAMPCDVVLTPLQQPTLFAFVAQLCEKLAIKLPAEIALAAAIDNSTALLPGWNSFKHGEYRLLISLPALENASLAQFAGVLAGDLATQTRTPLLRYRWLAAQVQERIAACRSGRDWIGQHLADMAQAAPAKFARAFDLLHKLIGAANRGLRKIDQHIARIDAKLQRPLLEEQDRYSALLTGSMRFTDLLIMHTRLITAAHDAGAKNREDRIEGGLVDDLPALIKHYYDGVEENFARTLLRRWEAETTPRSDEPPIVRERIEKIRSEDYPALIQDKQPATTLLQERDALARHVTLSAYQTAGLHFDPTNLMPVDALTFAATQDMLQRQQAAIYFNDWFRPFRFWSLADYNLIRDMPLQDAAAQLSVCVNEIRRLTPDRAKLLTEYERLQNQLREILLAQHVLAAGKKFSFRYLQYDGTTLVPILEERQQQLAALMEKLSQQETVMGGRITLGLRLSGQAEREVHDLHDAMRLLHDIGMRLYKLSLDCFQLEQLLQRHYQLREADYSLAIKKLETRIDDACTLLLTRLSDIPYPLDTRHASLKSFVDVSLVQPGDTPRFPILHRARRLLDVLYRVNDKLSLLAADYGTIAEEAYRIEPIKLINRP